VADEGGRERGTDVPEYKVDDEHRAFAKQQRRLMTRAEEMLWNVLRAGRLDGWKFKRQVPFGRFVADFCCAQARLVVELDGAPHERPEQMVHDQSRDAWFAEQGFRVVRISNDLVLTSMELAIKRIRETLTTPSPGSLRLPPSPSGGEG
jgi:very-short-patch-repair endonuclease